MKVYTCIGSEVWKERFWFTEKSWMFDEVEGEKLYETKLEILAEFQNVMLLGVSFLS